MPVVLRDGPYRFLFYASDRDEPPHVHMQRDDAEAKFWLEPIVRLARNVGFRPHELRKIAGIIAENIDELLEAWHEFFGH